MNIKGFFIAFLKITVLYVIITAFRNDKELNIFVSPNGKDGNNGTLEAPIRSMEAAKSLVRAARSNGSYQAINVNFMPGEYQLDETLSIGAGDGGTPTCLITYKAYKPGTVVISGGRQLPQKWVKDKVQDVWKLKLENDYGVVNQLFENGKRLQRSSSRVLYTTGPLRVYRKTIESFLIKGYDKLDLSYKLREKDIAPFCGFSYNHGDLDDLSPNDINNAELLLYHSWDCSLHNIGKMDKATDEIYLKSPSVYPVGLFSNRTRYIIENCKTYLTQPGYWCYNIEKREIYYKAKAGEDPNNQKFVVPVVKTLVAFKGDPDPSKRVQNVKFSGLSFKYTISPRGLQWHDDYLSYLVPDKTMPWLDLKTGAGIIQGAVKTGQAIAIQNADRIIFTDCSFSQLGAYAVNIYNYSDKNELINCRFFDLGAGGVLIGSQLVNLYYDKPNESLPKDNIIKNSKIHDYGIIYKSGLGISIMHATKSKIVGNEIFNAPYTGLSCGWTWGRGKSYTRETIIENNDIHDVMRELADGGGIYTLGNQPGTVIRNNTIHDIKRSKDAIGSRNNGIFFDEGSSRIYLDNNEIYNIENESIRYNIAVPSDITWGTNKFDGQEATGSDGQLLVSTKTLKYWLETDRLKLTLSYIIESDWFIYSLIVFTLVAVFVIKRIRKRKRIKNYKKQFNVKR